MCPTPDEDATAPAPGAIPAWLEGIGSEQILRLTTATLARPDTGGAAAEAVQFSVIRTNEMDAYDEPVSNDELLAAGVALAARDDFTGSDRAAAKLSVVDGTPRSFADIKALTDFLAEGDRADDAMEDRDPRIGRDPNSDRVDVEQVAVRVQAFLYAASREKDNDFHLILGRAPREDEDPVYMTAEISGLPARNADSFRTLKAARDAYKQFFSQNGFELPTLSYDFYNPPIPVTVEGSIFFDVTHSNGDHPGPKKLRPHIPTIWEIHPITSIEFRSTQ
jgi:hypothetical protein